MFIQNKKAFTLVELIVVITVVVVLSTISVPIYRGHIDKAKQAEGYALLAAIRNAQLNYFHEYRHFYVVPERNILVTANHEILGINCSNNKYFTTFTPNFDIYRVLTKFAFIASAYDVPKYHGIRLVYNITSGSTYTAGGSEAVWGYYGSDIPH